MMRVLGNILRRLWADQRGQTTIEYALLLVAIGLPAIGVFGLLVSILAENYRMVTFLELLPFP
jgi:Flp pilus assembly pilin Flp